jgi:hypothetical protein
MTNAANVALRVVLDFDARIREGSSRIFVYLQPGLSTQRGSIAVMALGALSSGCCCHLLRSYGKVGKKESDKTTIL